MLTNKTITFIGAGSMAESIFSGLIHDQLVKSENIIITNKSNHEKLNRLHEKYGVRTTPSSEEAVNEADVVILAMKPNHIENAASELKAYLNKEQLLVSVLAGVSTQYMENLFGNEPAVIRTMPNTSASVGASATAITAGRFATKEHLDLTAALFKAVGTVTVFENEAQIDYITGISGSGPAYMYYFVEAMEKAAEKAGLPKEESKEMIIQTLAGAAKRLASTDKTSKELYQEVMSPNGTTEAAFRVLEKNNVAEHFIDAMEASMKRAVELGSSPTS